MSEDATPAQTEAPVEAGEAQASFGEVLATARNAAGMSIDEVAAKLRLSPRQIRALEKGEASSLPDATFVRGFIRNYAKLLGLQAEPLIAAYDAIAPSPAMQTISLHSENIRIAADSRKNWLPYLLAILLLLSALLAWLALTRQDTPATAAPQPPIESTVSPETQPVDVPMPPAEPAAPAELPAEMPPAPTPTSPPGASAVPNAAAPASPASAPAEIAPVTGASTLEMTFSEEVWVSVLDRDGKEIYNRSKPANSQDKVEGLPPLQVVIGNAAGLRVNYNGKPVDLGPHTKARSTGLPL